ncbi:T9SS type A sorting domain-containing protein [Brumimicrobium mesophilum]|uniref:T9SS type A sorting domain-containing protein n=1 Tax=Brumimicrobium mesophilum TaxID=392717 RepID=UPI000D140ABE|nr:T9SS type A sorting domain-containing protein [Brumimicrobium mesophilum]
MKKILLSFTLLFTFISTSQTLQIADQYVFGGSAGDIPRAMLKADDHLILGGHSFSDISGDKLTANNGFVDLWLISLDDNKDVEWQVGYGGSMVETLNKIIHTSDNHLMVLATSDSGNDGNKTTTNKGGNDIWLIKLDLQGNEIWQKSYGGSGGDYAINLLEKSDGSFLIIGSSNSPISGDKTEPTIGSVDYWIVNIDANGNVLWDKVIGGSGGDHTQDAAIDTSGNVVILGYSSSPISQDKTEVNFGVSDNWLVKLDGDGNVLWDRTLGGDNADLPKKLIVSENRIFVLSSSFSNDSGTKTEPSRGGRDYWITKLDEGGNVILDKTYGGNNDDEINDGLISSFGDLIVTGSTNSDVSGEVELSTYNNSKDIWTLVLDTSDLSLKYQFMFGGDDSEGFPNILENNNSFNILIQSNSDIGGDKTIASRGGDDYWLLDISSDLSTFNFQKQESLSIYPNPTSNTFKISNLPAGEKLEISVVDMTGRTVLNSTVSETNNSVDVNSLSPGMYTLQMYDAGKKYTSKLVVE